MENNDFVMVPVKTLILMRRAITDDAPYGKEAIASYEKLKTDWRVLPPDRMKPECWRWRPRGATEWFYNPDISWLENQSESEIEKQPVFI